MKEFLNNIKKHLENEIKIFESKYGSLEDVIFKEYFINDIKNSKNLNNKFSSYKSELEKINSLQTIFHNMNMEDEFLNPDLKCLEKYEKELHDITNGRN